MAKTRLVIFLLPALLTVSLGGSRQFHYVPVAKTWKEAQSYCRKNFADLATIETVEDQNAMMQQIKSNNRFVWIGLYRSTNSWRNGLKWSDGSNTTLRLWVNGEPHERSWENCAVTVLNGWADIGCDNKYYFVCSIPTFKLYKVELKVGGSVDMNRPSVEEGVLSKIEDQMRKQGIHQKFRLSWRRQRDGKVFDHSKT